VLWAALKNKNIMTQETKNEKVIVTSELKFPFDIYMIFTVFILTITFILKQILFKIFVPTEWWFLLSISITAFGLLILMFRQQYKKLIIYDDRIDIKTMFSFRTQTIYFEELTGFELFETFFMRGFVSNVRIISKIDNDIVLHRDNYNNYDEIINGLKQSRLEFLGLNEVQEKYKNRYGKLLKWSAIIYPIIYGLFLLLKSAK
jgi:hypothetical protein